MTGRVSGGVFPPINNNKGFRTEQEYTAISVGDPVRREIPRTPDNAKSSSPDNGGSPQVQFVNNSKLNQLAQRQDQLYEHQVRVAGNQDKLSNQMSQQNQALNQALIRQALENKELMITDLNRQQDSQIAEHTRDLLTQHIKYMVNIVQRLNQEIEGLVAEIHCRDRAVVTTNTAVNKLEVHHVTMLQDLRGRIVRCDNSIAKHSKDLLYLVEENRRIEGMIISQREKHGNDIHRLEAEVISMTGELERQSGEQRGELTHLRKDAQHRLAMLEDGARQTMSEVRDMIDSQKSGMDHRMDKMESKFQAMINKATDSWSNVMVQVDRRIEDNSHGLMGRLQGLEQKMNADRGKMTSIEQVIENRVMGALESNLSYQEQELARAKAEFREGFVDVHDSINNAKRVVEGRRKLLATQLRKEIGQIRKRLLLELPNMQDGSTIVYTGV